MPDQPRIPAPAAPGGDRPLDLLVIGDANPDLILRGGDVVPVFGQHERIVEQGSLVLGGSGAITAVGAARLGLRTGMVAAVGDDVLGRFVLAELSGAGVDATAVRVTPDAPTGISVALAGPDDRAILTARGALAVFDPAAVPDAALRAARHVHIASPFLQPKLRTGLAALVARAGAAGATVSLDPGWDPEQRWSTVVAAATAVDVLLPNGQEAVRLAAALTAAHARPAAAGNEPPWPAGGRPRATPSGSPVAPGPPVPAGGGPPGRRDAAGEPGAAEYVAAARALAERGRLVVVKTGAEGATAVHGTTVVHGRPYPVRPVDATGAGDSFDAGFLAGWLDGAELTAAVALGCACGALSTRAAGGTAGQPTREEAEDFVAGVAAR